MLRTTRQNVSYINPTFAGTGLGDPVTIAITVEEAFNKLKSLFSGSSNPWIPAQNQASSELASIVADYVAVKNNNQLTSIYIANAISKVNIVIQAFKQFASQYNNAGANKGISDITANGNAIIQNMKFDLSILPVSSTNLVTSVTAAAQGTTAGIPNMLLIGLAAVFVLPKIFKR